MQINYFSLSLEVQYYIEVLFTSCFKLGADHCIFFVAFCCLWNLGNLHHVIHFKIHNVVCNCTLL